MLSNRFGKLLITFAGFCLALSSCASTSRWRDALSQNVLWSSADGRIKIKTEGGSFDEGHGVVLVNGEEMTFGVYFNESFNHIEFYVADETNEKTGIGAQLLCFRVDSVIDGKKLSVTLSSWKRGDPYYDDHEYSTILSSRPLEEAELDARFFGNGWIDDKKDFFVYNLPNNILTTKKRGTYKGKDVYLSFLDGPRFEIEYLEGGVFASGSYVTHFDSMDLIFDEECGRQEFGEDMQLRWSDATGNELSSLKW